MYIYIYICIHSLGRIRMSDVRKRLRHVIQGICFCVAPGTQKLQRCHQIFHRDGGSPSLDPKKGDCEFIQWELRQYFVGIFPYIGLIYGRYLEFMIWVDGLRICLWLSVLAKSSNPKDGTTGRSLDRLMLPQRLVLSTVWLNFSEAWFHQIEVRLRLSLLKDVSTYIYIYII